MTFVGLRGWFELVVEVDSTTRAWLFGTAQHVVVLCPVTKAQDSSLVDAPPPCFGLELINRQRDLTTAHGLDQMIGLMSVPQDPVSDQRDADHDDYRQADHV